MLLSGSRVRISLSQFVIRAGVSRFSQLPGCEDLRREGKTMDASLPALQASCVSMTNNSKWVEHLYKTRNPVPLFCRLLSGSCAAVCATQLQGCEDLWGRRDPDAQRFAYDPQGSNSSHNCRTANLLRVGMRPTRKRSL